MKIKKKGLIIVSVALLMFAVIASVYALGDQSGNLQQKRDQECTPECSATRAYGEDTPAQAQEEKPEELSEEETLEEVETPIQEQSQIQEQLRESNCENPDCEENQSQYQYKFQEHCRYGREED